MYNKFSIFLFHENKKQEVKPNIISESRHLQLKLPWNLTQNTQTNSMFVLLFASCKCMLSPYKGNTQFFYR